LPKKFQYDYQYHFEKCGKCGREILVETILFGMDHTANIIVTCKECLKKAPLPEEFIKERPEEAKVIMEWLQKEQPPTFSAVNTK
jgi:nitrogenase molybdenum-iron protein alpha/beta subunit